MKSNHITLRISNELRESLEMESQKTGKKISEVIRDGIKNLNTTKNSDSTSGNTVSIDDSKLHVYLGYVKLISFMYRKRETGNIEEEDDFIFDLLLTAEHLTIISIVPPYLKENICYVRDDLTRALDRTNPYFFFSFPAVFDYEELENFINNVDIRALIAYL